MQGRYGEAIDAFERSLAINGEYKDRWARASAHNLGIVYQSKGRYAEAIDAFERSMAIKPSTRTGGRGRDARAWATSTEPGAVRRGDRRAFERSLAIKVREYKDRVGEGRASSNLGNVYAGPGPARRGDRRLERSLAISREHKDHMGEGRTLGNLALFWEARGELARSLPLAA